MQFDRFTAALKYRKISGKLVEVPRPSVGLNLNDVGPGTETDLRRLVFGALNDCCPDKRCFILDVNHQYWEFLPKNLKFTRAYEPIPCTITPHADSICLSCLDFSTGLFSNWSNGHMAIFGNPLINVMKESDTFSRRIVDVAFAESLTPPRTT